MKWLQRLGVVLAVLAFLVLLAWQSGNRPDVNVKRTAEAREGISLHSRFVDAGDVKIHVMMAGPADGIPVLLLHGFPESWFSWHRQIAALARSGMQVAAPDLRGYGRSGKPDSPAEASGAQYARDMIAVLDGLGWKSAHLSAHDIGAGVAWRLIFEHPERIRSAFLFNATHPLAWEGATPESDPDTISWFRSFFKLPWLPEIVGRAGGYALLSKNLRDTAREGIFSDVELDVYKSIWARDGTLSTMIDSYRAPFTPIKIPPGGRPSMPVKVMWGEQDAFLPVAGAALSEPYLGKENIIRVPQAGHWILLEEPDLTSDAMVEFFLTQ